MTVYFGSMNLPAYGQTSHQASYLDTPECCVFCYQHVNSSSCPTVQTWLERMFQLNTKRLCKVCLRSHFSNEYCSNGRKPCQYCGALKKHHESVCPGNPFLEGNDKPTPNREEEAPIEDELQKTMKTFTDKGLCHKCFGRHCTETCNTWLRCQTCGSGYHHQILCPKSSSLPSNSNTDAPSSTLEDRPVSPLSLDLTGPSLKSLADSSTPAEASSQPSDNEIVSPRYKTMSSVLSDDSSVVWNSSNSSTASCETPALCPSAQPTKPFTNDASAKVNQGNGKCWLQNLRKGSAASTSSPEAEKNHLFIDNYSMEYYRKMYEELLSCDNVIDNEMASPLSTHQAVDIDTQNRCSSPSEASDDSFVMWQAPDSPVPSVCRWGDTYSPSSLCDDDGVEMDCATDVKSAVRSSAVSTDEPVLCLSSKSTKPSNDCSKKTHLEILFSGGRIDENVAPPESRSDDEAANISNEKVKCWLKSLRKDSPESTSSPTAEKEWHTSNDYLEYYSKMHSEVSKICERAEKEPQHYNYYYFCYNYYVYYFYASVYLWLAANASNFDASAGESNVTVSSQPTQMIDNESRNRCSSSSSEASDDSFIMWQSPDSPVPSKCCWDETYSPSFDEDFDNDMDA